MDRRILVVDDSELVCQQIAQVLKKPERIIEIAANATEALETLIEGQFSLLLTDLRLPGRLSGMDLLREIGERGWPVTTIAMTGFASVDSAVEAIRLGAYDYLPKPLDHLHLELIVERALEDRRLLDEVQALKSQIEERLSREHLLGQSPRMRSLISMISRVAASPINVLINGETGTGKEMVARAIHGADPSRTGRWIAVNCAVLPAYLLESELFGHERGSFTGADQQKIGRFELARDGTLFLDEIGELPLTMQAKLLRVLQDGTFERVGGTEVLSSNARVLTATNTDLAQLVAEGKFREDLYYRLKVITLELPPLRERPEDLPLLVDHFLKRQIDRGRAEKSFSRAALGVLARYEWPGNVRELENLISKLVLTSSSPVIEPSDLPSGIRPTLQEPFSMDYDVEKSLPEITQDLTERIEKAYLTLVLEKYRGRIDRCAEHCGLSRRSISEKLRRYAIDKSEFKSNQSGKPERARSKTQHTVSEKA